MTANKQTDFGFQQVSPGDKTRLVGEVFSSVANNYDLMNDLMSFGLHRLWKSYALRLLAARHGERVLDLAGGTGDLALRIARDVQPQGRVVIGDINAAMLSQGRDRCINQGVIDGIDYVQTNAEQLPFAKNSFDAITIAFGLRNVTDKQQALKSMYDSIRYGGRLLILEFSKVVIPLLQRMYDSYSFHIIPWLGKTVAQDEASYRYLVESIRKHPDQRRLKVMLQQAGFEQVSYQNLSGGIVAIHTAYKL